MEIGQIFGISEILKALMPEIMTILLFLAALLFARHKIQSKREKAEEFRGWLLVEVAMLLFLSFYVPFKFLDLWIGHGIALGVIALIAAIFYSIYFLLASNNCFFTFVREGTAKFIVKGDQFNKCLIQWKGKTFAYQKDHPEKWNVISGEERKTHPHKFRRFFYGRLGGLRFYGLWPLYDVHIYKFRWTGVTEDGKEVHKEEWLDYILLKDDVYLCKVPAAEDKNLLPLDLQLFLTIRIQNPYKARFKVQNWLETVINRMQPMTREFVAQYTYNELVPIKHIVGSKVWEKLKDAALVGTKGEFLTRYGVDVRKIEVRQIEPPESWRKVTLAKYEAEKKAEAIIAEAEGEKRAIILKAEGEAERISKTFSKVKEFGDNGFLLKIAEEAKGKDVPALVLTHHLAARFEKILGRPITEEEFKEILSALSQLDKTVEKVVKIEGR